MNKQLRIAIGLLLLVVTLIALISPLSMLLPQGIQIIDTEFRGSSGDEQYVRTKLNFGDQDLMENLPLENLGWTRTPVDQAEVEAQLGADILLAWNCRHTSSSSRIWFLILQSKDVSSFHPPPVCYAALGYDIQEESTLEIAVSGDTWAKDKSIHILGEKDSLFFSGTMSAKRLVITKDCDGSICDKRVVLYFYIKPSISETPKEVTMIRISAVVPVNGSFDHIQALEKKLIADVFPLMFEARDADRSVAQWLIEEYGGLGWLAVAAIMIIPVGFLAYPSIRNRIVKSPTTSE